MRLRSKQPAAALVAVAVAVVVVVALTASTGALAASSRPGSAPRAAPPSSRVHVGAWRPHLQDAARYAAHRRAGAIAYAVCTAQGCRGRDERETFPSASLLKPMLMLADLRRGAVRDRPLDAGTRALLEPMIRRSDDDAATRVLGVVGTQRLGQVARAAGMRRFTPVQQPWGDSRIDAVDQARFFLHVDALVPRRHRAFAMRLLASVVPSQRWGIGEVAPRGWRLYFKGGWGSGTGRVDHQTALLVRGRRRVAVSVLTEGDGTHAYGKQTLRGLFARLLRGL